ncbi:MAG: ACT domain protein [Thermoplasmatales archaeon]|nr:ACT domain protein [Thermoplasmatales archaeon]
MKNWEYGKVEGGAVGIDEHFADMMGLVEGGYVYGTLFKHGETSSKEYELILSMYPQENYRTLTNITMYLQDVPGSSAQAARFLAGRGINVLNSISLNGISDTMIIWKMLADLSFSGEVDLLKEAFAELKRAGDPSVSKIDHIEARQADIGRVFRSDGGMDKVEIKKAPPITLENGRYDLIAEYGEWLAPYDGGNVLITADYASWMVSISFLSEGTSLMKIGLSMPDCPGSITQVLDWIASKNINLISVFTKVKICYQAMTMDLVANFKDSTVAPEDFPAEMEKAFGCMNGVFELTEFGKLG